FVAGGTEDEVRLERGDGVHPVSGFGNVKVGSDEPDQQRRHRGQVNGKTISLTEAGFVLHGFKYVHSDADYIHVNTSPAESRGGILKQKKGENWMTEMCQRRLERESA
ncbi:hypothetical protein FOL47_000837, partial [Perkinsus chesapeaki]